jgi:hypothetical protein
VNFVAQLPRATPKIYAWNSDATAALIAALLVSSRWRKRWTSTRSVIAGDACPRRVDLNRRCDELPETRVMTIRGVFAARASVILTECEEALFPFSAVST